MAHIFLQCCSMFMVNACFFALFEPVRSIYVSRYDPHIFTLHLICFTIKHGSLNVPIEHHPTIRYMVYNGYYKVLSNIPKMGQLPTPVKPHVS